MTPKENSEKFQPRMVASFNKPQLESVGSWLRKVVLDSIDLDRGLISVQVINKALERGELDEKSKIMDVKSANRLIYGLATINALRGEGVRLDQVIGTIQVWQTTPDENKLEFRYDTSRPRNSGLTRH